MTVSTAAWVIFGVSIFFLVMIMMLASGAVGTISEAYDPLIERQYFESEDSEVKKKKSRLNEYFKPTKSFNAKPLKNGRVFDKAKILGVPTNCGEKSRNQRFC